eukprot:3250940-Rhodomonas_salina.2
MEVQRHGGGEREAQRLSESEHYIHSHRPVPARNRRTVPPKTAAFAAVNWSSTAINGCKERADLGRERDVGHAVPRVAVQHHVHHLVAPYRTSVPRAA